MSQLGRLSRLLRTLEGPEDFLTDELVEVDQGLRENERFLVEAYVDGKMGLGIHVRVPAVPADYPAIVYIAKRGFEWQSRVGFANVGGSARRDVVGQDDRNSRPVFVFIPKGIEKSKPNPRVRSIRSVVRLQALDDLERLGRDRTAKEWRDLGPKLRAITRDRKTDLPVILEGQFVNKVVKRGPEIVNEVSEDQADAVGDFRPNVNPKVIPASLRIRFLREGVRIGLHESLDFPIEIVQMEFCTLNPLEWPVYWTHLGGNLIPSGEGKQAEDTPAVIE